MDRLKAFCVALVAGLALSGCTITVAPAQLPAAASSVVAVPQDNDSLFDQAFVAEFTKQIGYAPNADVINSSRELGKATCKALDAGATATQVINTLLESAPQGPQQDGLLIAAGTGVGIYCPQYIKEF